MSITIRSLLPVDVPVCDDINRSLPDWFGLEEGLVEASEYLETHHGLVAVLDDEVVGYLTWYQPFPESAEISWMAVRATHHRRGVGRVLIAELDRILRAEQSRCRRSA